MSGDRLDLLERIQELEKENRKLKEGKTPMKILNKVDENGEPCLSRGHGLCPMCNSLVKCTDKYCHKCGQAISWGED